LRPPSAPEDGTRVSVNPFDEDVWLHLAMRNGTIHTVISRADAQRLMEGLQAILAAQPA
jgi:hypothetical protein